MVTGYSHDGDSGLQQQAARGVHVPGGQQGVQQDRGADEPGADPIAVLPHELGEAFAQRRPLDRIGDQVEGNGRARTRWGSRRQSDHRG